MTIIIGI